MTTLLFAAFVASAVEIVEMVIIVVGVGATRGWRSTLLGAGTGLVALAVTVGVLGGTLALIPIEVVRVIIGALLLSFGLQWLRKGIIGVADHGFVPHGDSPKKEQGKATAPGASSPESTDWTAFVLAFKGVLLEGLEVAFIVVALGAGDGGGKGYLWAGLGAGAAAVLVGGAGAMARGSLEKLPGRTLKFGVGGLLTTFGTFWAMQGLGVHWPGEKISVVWLYALYLGASFVLLAAVRGGAFPSSKEAGSGPAAHGQSEGAAQADTAAGSRR